MKTELFREEKRDSNIDFLRGLVMLLLPLFHSTTGIIHSVIGVYQMPLLMGISGYLSEGRDRTIDILWIKKRFCRLMIPFLFWSIVYWAPIFYKQSRVDIDAVTSTVFWFFLVLFIFSVVIWGVTRIEKFLNTFLPYRYWIVIIMLSVDLFIKMIALISNIHVVSLCAWHITFYFSGYLLHREKLNFHGAKPIWSTGSLSDVAVMIGCIIAIILLENSRSIVLNPGLKILFDYATTICAIFIIVGITKYLPTRIKNLFIPFSIHSTYIYIIHFFLLGQWCYERITNTIICTLSGIIIPLGIAFFINK